MKYQNNIIILLISEFLKNVKASKCGTIFCSETFIPMFIMTLTEIKWKTAVPKKSAFYYLPNEP
jgi:hypothetical protein